MRCRSRSDVLGLQSAQIQLRWRFLFVISANSTSIMFCLQSAQIQLRWRSLFRNQRKFNFDGVLCSQSTQIQLILTFYEWNKLIDVNIHGELLLFFILLLILTKILIRI